MRQKLQAYERRVANGCDRRRGQNTIQLIEAGKLPQAVIQPKQEEHDHKDRRVYRRKF